MRKIVSVDDARNLGELKKALRAGGCEIIKELPLINGFLINFPEDEAVIAFRGLSDKITLEEDLQFSVEDKGKTSWFFPFYFFFKPKPQPEPPQPEDPSGKKIDKAAWVDWGLQRMGANEAWPKLKKQNRIRVGIIDTGIDYNHPDLKGNIREGICTLDGMTSYLDDVGHGTHVAGVIGACNPDGMVGVNPYVDFYIVKAFNKSGGGNLADIIEGFDWLLQKKVSIINMSFSTGATNQSFTRAISVLGDKGIVLVAAAGNDGGAVTYPARFPQVLAVTAVDKKEKLANFSSHGPEVDFCAPGVDVKSCWIGPGYALKSGTSMACPHVAGAAAAVMNYLGPLTAAQTVSALQNSAVFLKDLTKEEQGYGLIELARII